MTPTSPPLHVSTSSRPFEDHLSLTALLGWILQQAATDLTLGLRSGIVCPVTLRLLRHHQPVQGGRASDISSDQCQEAVAFLTGADGRLVCDLIATLTGRELVTCDFLVRRALRNATDPTHLNRDPLVQRQRRDRLATRAVPLNFLRNAKASAQLPAARRRNVTRGLGAYLQPEVSDQSLRSQP